MSTVANPKTDPHPPSNAEKNPDDWTTGGEPMTGAQASYLKTLSEQAHDPEAFDDGLTKAEASKRIDSLREKAGRRGLRRSSPPVTRRSSAALALRSAQAAGRRPASSIMSVWPLRPIRSADIWP